MTNAHLFGQLGSDEDPSKVITSDILLDACILVDAIVTDD